MSENKDWRDFIQGAYKKKRELDQKRDDSIEDEELSNRQKGARKGHATKANRKFIDMLTKDYSKEDENQKVNDKQGSDADPAPVEQQQTHTEE